MVTDYDFVRKEKKNEVYSETTPGTIRSKGHNDLIIMK
jgi:hypothetical protein